MTVEIKTIGCRQNQYESAVLKAIFEDRAPFNLEGDIVIINGCSVTSRAVRDTRKIIRKAKNEGKKVVITGCLSDKNIIDKNDMFYLDNATKHKLVYGQTNIYNPTLSRPMISIETGCNEFCSYCIVPYLRGKPFIRNIEDIKKEIEILIAKGFFEFVLTGTNIALAMDNINTILDWAEKNYPDIVFRLSSLDPAIIKNHIELFLRPNIAHTAHLSMQSLSNDILRVMKRRHNVNDVYKITDKLIDSDPLFAVGGDLIIGFPTEGKNEFEETKRNIRNLPFSYLHVFEYSPREGTLAELLKNRLPNEKIKEHLREIHSIVDNKKEQFMKKNIGTTHKSTLLRDNIVLTTNYLNVNIIPTESIRNTVEVTIENIKDGKLYGKIT